MPVIEKDGETIGAIQPHMLEDWLAGNDLTADQVTIRWSDAETKARKRARIEQDAGDLASLLGTTRDTALMALVKMARMATALKAANTLAEVRAAATPFADLMAPYLAKIDANPPTAKLPYVAKGEAAVIEEIETRATAVAEALDAQE